MEFFTTDTEGLTLIDPGAEARRKVLESVLEDPGAEFPEVFLTTRDGTVLGYRAGRVLFQEDGGEVVRVVPKVDIETAARAWTSLIEGDLEALEILAWQDVQ